MVTEVSSTMTGQEVAAIMVNHGIKKHNDRYAAVFMKAVSLAITSLY